MLPQEPRVESFAFSCFEVNLATGEVFRNGRRVRLSGQPSQVLVILVQRAGQLVTREDLRVLLWPDETFVDFDHGLNNCMNRIRDVLGDSATKPRFIETLPKQGYRFIAPIKAPDSCPQPARDGLQSTDGQRRIIEILSQLGPRLVPPAAVERNGNVPAVSENREALTPRSISSRSWALIAVVFASVLLAAAAWLAYKKGHVNAPGQPIQSAALTQMPGHHLIEQRVTSNSPEAPVEHAIVSPDGKYLTYSDPTGLYLRVIGSGETRRWDVPKDFIAAPSSWFPDGTNLLVTRWKGSVSKPSLWKLSLLGADPRMLIDNAGYGSVSPDGKRIAFVSDLSHMGRELWVMAADGSNSHKIAEADSHDTWLFPPVWSPDGRRLAYLKFQGAMVPLAPLASIWTRDAEGSDPQEIVADAPLGTGLAWAPDGRILYASRTNPAAAHPHQSLSSVRVDLRTGKALGEPRVLTEGTGSVEGISVAADGRRLVLWRTNISAQAYITEFDAHTRKWKTPRRLTLDANGNVADAWMADSRTVLFVSNRNGAWTLFKQPMDETTAEVLVEGQTIYLPRLSADGAQVLYQSRVHPANDPRPVSLMRLPVAGGPPQLILQDVALGNYQCARLPSTLCLFDRMLENEIVFVSFDPERGAGHEVLRIRRPGGENWTLSPNGRTLAAFQGSHSIRFYSLRNGAFRESNTVTLNDWSFWNGDWSADGTGILVPSKASSGTPVMLEVDQAGKASVVLEGAANIEFWFMIPAPDGHHAILGAQVPGDNNAWMIDNY